MVELEALGLVGGAQEERDSGAVDEVERRKVEDEAITARNDERVELGFDRNHVGHVDLAHDADHRCARPVDGQVERGARSAVFYLTHLSPTIAVSSADPPGIASSRMLVSSSSTVPSFWSAARLRRSNPMSRFS